MTYTITILSFALVVILCCCLAFRYDVQAQRYRSLLDACDGDEARVNRVIEAERKATEQAERDRRILEDALNYKRVSNAKVINILERGAPLNFMKDGEQT